MSHLVYRLQPHEYQRYREHLLTLDPTSRYNRFAHHIKDESVLALCEQWEHDPKNHKLFVIENEDLAIVAVGHIAFCSNQMELALSVLKQYQGQGMGSSLMSRCIEWCQNRGIHTGCMTCLATNTAVRKLASKHGILINDHGDAIADIKIPNSTAGSVLHEVMDSNLAKLDHLGKLQRKFARSLYNL